MVGLLSAGGAGSGAGVLDGRVARKQTISSPFVFGSPNTKIVNKTHFQNPDPDDIRTTNGGFHSEPIRGKTAGWGTGRIAKLYVFP